jgi:hypothetical protein
MTRELHTYAYVDVPFDLASRLFAENAQAVLQHATDDVAEEAGKLSRTLKVNVGGFDVAKEVEVLVGEFEPAQLTRSTVPIRWRAERGRLLFPTLEADLHIVAISLDPPLTMVELTGTYEPPMGAVGAGADKLLLHRLAEASVYRFVHDIAMELRDLVDELPPDERM